VELIQLACCKNWGAGSGWLMGMGVDILIAVSMGSRQRLDMLQDILLAVPSMLYVNKANKV
jgi:hypothetical protein